MKAFHIADTHIKTGPRWNECRRVLDHFALRVEQEKPEIVLHAGDLFDARSNPTEMAYAEKWVQRIARVSKFVIVPGNHDDALEIESLGRLDPSNQIIPLIHPSVVTIAGLQIVALQWPTMSSVVAEAETLELGMANDTSTDHLRAIMQHLGKQAVREPTIALIHAMVNGSKTSHGQPLRGFDFSLSIEDLRWLNCDSVAMGHIHHEQDWRKPYWCFRYCGSPFHTDFGDFCRKSFTIWDYDASGVMTFPITETLPAHQMIEYKVDCIREDSSFEIEIPPSFIDVEFKLTYSFQPECAASAHQAAKNWKRDAISRGAYNVILNPVSVATVATRIPEVATAIAPVDKLIAYMKARGEDPVSEQNQRIVEKFKKVSE